MAREVTPPKDTIDPVPPQESEPDAAGRAATVSAQTASLPADDPAGTPASAASANPKTPRTPRTPRTPKTPKKEGS